MIQYDKNIQAVMGFLEAENYSASVVSLHRICYREFRRYLSENGLVFSMDADDNMYIFFDMHHLLYREDRADSTVNIYRSSIVRFCRYLDNIGIDSFDKVTADTLFSFNLQDKHATAEGKCAYNCRIRNFLIYLAEEKVINNWYLYKALPSLSAPKTRIIETLDNK